MRRTLRKYIPSMFERRLLLLMMLTLALAGVVLARTAYLTTGDRHREAFKQAEQVLYRVVYIPTIRGMILDRRGRVLAEDRPGYDVAVSYDLLTGAWAFNQAYDKARNQHRSVWKELSSEEREAIVANFRSPFDRQEQELFRTLSELGPDLRGIATEELDKRRNAVIAQVQGLSADATFRRQQRQLAQLDEPISWSEAEVVVSEETQRHSLLLDVNDQVRAFVEGCIADAERAQSAYLSHPRDEQAAEQAEASSVWLEVSVTRPKHRRYPLETWPQPIEMDMSSMPPELRRDEPVTVDVAGVALPIIGRMREVFAEDMRTNPFAKDNLHGYMEGDRVGATGIESFLETTLRGERGKLTRRLDTGTEQRIEPIPGREVHLTIDADLQAKLQALLSEKVGLTAVRGYHTMGDTDPAQIGKPLDGAAVILSVDNCEVLAAASVPDYSLKQLEENPDSVFEDLVRLPYLFRPVANKYNPGSTIKALVLTSAVTAGSHDLNSPIECTGALDLDHPDRYRCWIFKTYRTTHGLVDAPRSLCVSCNIYYYTLGRRMGVLRLADWFGRFGLGKLSDCGLPEEITGSLPDPKSGTVDDAINMGIGQGPVAWTPLQAAAAYACLANGGVYQTPTFIADADRPASRPKVDLHLNQPALRAALEGLHDVVSNTADGTGYWLDRSEHETIFNVEGVTIFGKSGTADAGRTIYDYVDGKLVPVKSTPPDETPDHAWFIVIVKPEHAAGPMYVIAVITEYAGSGSRVSGPVVNQIIHLMQQEGYL
ncbi:MAG: hypothetical protein IT445_11970 [Phycisphaeraceae bacterium]|nr:hypothetical protein [Phycisphaeraceae bacterium]